MKAILLIIALWVLFVSIDTDWRLRRLNARLDDIRDTWILATTPASSVEEINAEDLTLQKHNYPYKHNYQEEVK